MALVVLGGAAGTLVWWATHPAEVFSGGYGMGSSRDPGKTFWTPLAHSRDADVSADVVITGLSPRVRKDTADASVDYLICVLDTDYLAAEGIGAFIMGGEDADLDRYCTSTRPAVGSTFHLGASPPEEVLVGVTPGREGRSVIADHRVDYRIGWQRGHDTINVSTDLRSPRQDVRPPTRQAPRPSR